MEGKHIQILSSDIEPRNLLHFDLPPNYLFEKFPYLSHVINPSLNKIVKNGIADNIELQK